ncbi:acylphosphatase [Desulfobacula sp.]|uniref:acylphosphatase n=1 Tax=Desulfobacula sp. TaxID=2593537 RepID=UPI0025BFE0C7|nr:acylphosphatase [Desulfobacula sp.]
MPNKTQIKVIVSGRVQGVFYRAETKNTADRLDVKGYVKNLPNGSVEAVFEGDGPAVTQMMEWCHKGPPAAKVEHVLAEKAEVSSNFESFEIKY